MDKIMFTMDGENAAGSPLEVAFYVLEQTMIGGSNYILVTDSEEDKDGEALILKELPSADETHSIYEIVEDETELNAVAAVFNNLLEDATLSGEGYGV